MKIGIDIDGVIADFVDEFNKIIYNKYDFKLRESDIYVHDIYLVLGITLEDSLEIIYETLQRNLKMVAKAKNSIKKLNKDHEIYILTARDKKFTRKTLDWLDDKSIPYDEILFLNEGEKFQCKEKFDVIIEDCLKDAINWRKKVKYVILYDRPWNQTLDIKNLLIHLKNWDEIVQFIKKISN